MTAFGHYFDESTKEIHATKENLALDDRGLGYVLFHQLKKHAEEGLIAQIDAATGHKDSFSAYLKRCIRLAISLRNMGIEQGDIIAICSYNHLNCTVPWIAGLFLRATIAPTDPSISLEDQRHLLNLVKPKVIFVSSGSEDLIEEVLKPLEFQCEIISFAWNNKYRRFATMIEKQENEYDFEPQICEDPTETCLILFSSGTTGLPKGICLNHYFIMNGFGSMASISALKPRMMLYSSLYWISAIFFQTTCFYAGFERVVCTSFEPNIMWEYVNIYQVQVMFLAPVQAIKSLQPLTKRQSPLPIKMLAMGGSAIAESYYQQLRDLLPTTFVVNGYGQTELGFVSLFKGPDNNYKKLDSVGYLSSNLIAKIVNPDTEEVLGLNQEGELRVKSPYAMNGYYKQDSSSVWDEDGFIKTGDIGYFDDELCLFLTDRIKEMFKYMSWHIVPTKLEAILQSHPSVELAIVVGIPHPTDDNHACGAVTLIENSMVTGEELEQFVEERVDERNRLRAGVVILEKMPMTATGKIKRKELKELLQELVVLKE